MKTTIDPTALRTWRAFLEAHAKVVRVLETELESETGLPLTWFDVLVQLSESPDKQLRMQQLAERLLISRSGFTRLCDRMEAAGLIRRARCATDRRGVYAAITDKGRKALADAAPVHLRGIQQHFSQHLTDRDEAALMAALGKISQAAQEIRRAG